MLYLVLQLLVQTDFLGCPSHFTEALALQEKASKLSFHGKTTLRSISASQALPCRAQLICLRTPLLSTQRVHYYTVKPDVI